MLNVWAGGVQVGATERTEELLVQEIELLSKSIHVVGRKCVQLCKQSRRLQHLISI